MAENIPALPPGFVLQRADATPPLPPGFQLQKPTPSGKHYTFEEGQKLLEQERLQGTEGEITAGLTSMVEGVPIVGPALLDAETRAAAGLSSMITGEKYDDVLKRGRGIIETSQEQNPIVSTVGQVVGGVAGTAPLVAAAPAAFGIGAASLPARMVASGLSGAALGAADGGVRDGAEGALWGGGLGGALGVAGPAVGDVAGRAVRSVMNGRAQNEAARLAGTNRGAVANVARVLAADNATGATNANIAAAGPRAMLADAGESTLGLLDTAIARGGPNAGVARQRVNVRAAGAADDIAAALDNGLGAPEGMVKPLTELRIQSQPARYAAYEGPTGAYAQSIDYADPRGQALEKIIKGRVPAAAINKANELMRAKGVDSQQILANIADDGTVTFEKLPDVRQIDYITRALKDVAAETDGKGKLGGKTALGQAYEGLSREIRNLTKALVPEYKVALDTAAEPIAAREAKLFGQTMLSPSVARDEVEEFVSGLSAAELKSLKGGLRSQFAERLANVKRTAADPNTDVRQGVVALRELSSDAAREKLATIMGKPEADKMLAAVDQAAKSFEVRAGVATNSRTYGRQAGDRALQQQAAPGFVEQAASGSPLKSAQGFFQSLMGTGPEAQLAREDAIAGELANLLTQPVGQGGGAFLQAMQRAAQQIPVSDRKAQSVTNAITRGAALSSQPAQRLIRN